jgi:hypothetical protein
VNGSNKIDKIKLMNIGRLGYICVKLPENLDSSLNPTLIFLEKEK